MGNKDGIIVAAVLSAQTPDTTGEILDIKNADISSIEGAPINTEHVNPEDIDKDESGSEINGFNTIIGRVLRVKKIFSEKDCDNELELKAWKDLEVPLLFGYLKFFDGENAHDNAKAAASLVKLSHQSGEPHMMGFSVEGSILSRDGNVLKETVIKRIAATLKPANKAARIIGVIDESDKDKIKKSEQAQNEEVLKKTYKGPSYMLNDKLYNIETALERLKKALSVDGKNTAPSALTGGAALQKERFGLKSVLSASLKGKVTKNGLKKIFSTGTPKQLGKLHSFIKSYKLKKYEEQSAEAYEDIIKIIEIIKKLK